MALIQFIVVTYVAEMWHPVENKQLCGYCNLAVKILKANFKISPPKRLQARQVSPCVVGHHTCC